MVISSDGKPMVDSRHKKALDLNGKSMSASLLMNGQTARLKPLKDKKKKKRVFRIGNLFRIAFWYFIITGLYCPSSLDSTPEDSPKACKVYFQITDLSIPIIRPYFDTYALPHLEPVLPYYVEAYKRVITPTLIFGRKYGIPFVEKTIVLGKFFWVKFAQPRAEKLYEISYQYYRKNFGPYVDNANKAIIINYYTIQKIFLPKYSNIILSYYDAIKPQIVKGYILAYNVITKNLYPCLKWTVANGEFFFVRTVQPKLKSLYGESVEPQLLKISERLDKYRNARKTKSVSSDVKREVSHQVFKVETNSYMESIPSPSTTKNSDSIGSGDDTCPELSIREKAQKMVASDLKEWQEKYSNSADEAADELEIRVAEIANKFISNQIDNIGIALLKDLKKTVKSGLEKLKADITSFIRESNDNMDKIEALSIAVRKTGISVNEKAQLIRTWRQTQNQKLTEQVDKVVSEILEVLDTIRDLGLQEVGMRWAWSEGVTYKHWAKYHAMKAKFSQWRQDVESMATENSELRIVRLKLDEIEMEALRIAEETVTDLTSLKEIGLWKISVKDASDNFDTKALTNAETSKIKVISSEIYNTDDDKLSSFSSHLHIVTPCLQISETSLPASTFFPSAEDEVMGKSTSVSMIGDVNQVDGESSAWEPNIDSKRIPEAT
ncbi:hypothetical protein OnM2_060015 [Erysiphe neolycopersici]|uniref:Uncharacterized protein n=1 Tax=Erysiphe neolycopersici TaxID=212602 RepID=A0A420HPW0_9PEZI|nr:hypothetical protein OnM2_060015 [Erysiphe neolycopersici]